ncbi:hypothetical protein EB796_003010 [Bugula neritina]|uniref:Glycoside hydrolase family 31 N-terminal domain-containing protein n=1 Tax=Bugula neritina TaxID=10212 RepID=A0A7J7KKU8_BUGNE|nr:hypothetical protein EB796_003010 [Bugula neritina]
MKVCTALFVLLFVNPALAVDRNNFKTCDESGFCKRQRAYTAPATPHYHLVADSLVVSSDSAQFDVKNTKYDILFVVKLTGYSNGIVRVHMNEKSPIKPRYEVPPGDVVLEHQLQSKISKFSIVSQSSEAFTLSLPNTETTVKVTSPFLVEVLSGDTTVLQLNSRGLMKFEHLRLKPESKSEPEPPADGEDGEKPEGEEPAPADAESEQGEETKPEEEEEHAMWEEKYKSHNDAKPNGPTSIGVDITFTGFEHVYGIPEHGDSFALRSTVDRDPYRLYNLDVFEYELDNGMALYGSVPVMLAHNAARTIVNRWANQSITISFASLLPELVFDPISTNMYIPHMYHIVCTVYVCSGIILVRCG